jgi:hypothetical protein
MNAIYDLTHKCGSLVGIVRKILRRSYEASSQSHGGTKQDFQAYENTLAWVQTATRF